MVDKNLKYALLAIIIIALIYELNHTVGIGLFILAIMGMLLTYFTKNPVMSVRQL